MIFNLFPFQGKVYLAYVFFHEKSNKALFIYIHSIVLHDQKPFEVNEDHD